MRDKNSINIIVAGKTDEPQWLTPDEARQQSEQGVMVWDFASDENPDIVIAVAGDYLVKEGLAAIKLAKAEYSGLKVSVTQKLSRICYLIMHVSVVVIDTLYMVISKVVQQLHRLTCLFVTRQVDIKLYKKFLSHFQKMA